MAVRWNSGSSLALALPVFAGLLAPTTAAQVQVDDSLGLLPTPAELETPHAPTKSGLRGLVLSMHRMFGEILLPTEDPAQLIRELQSAVRYLQAPKTLEKKVALAKGTDIAFSLLQDTGRILGLVGLCFSVAIVVPMAALGILCSRFLCGICGGGIPSAEPENVGDSSKRRRWSIVFCVLTGLMTFALLGAFFTKDHLKMAVHGAKKQANFLVTALPLVIDRHLQLLDELVVTNIDQLQEAMTTRAKSCEGEVSTAFGDLLENSERLKFLHITFERLQKIERRMEDVEAVITGPKIEGVRLKIVPAFSVLNSAALLCSPPCPAQMKQELTHMALQLDIDRRIAPLQDVMDFTDDLKGLNLRDRLGDIPSPDSLTKTIGDLANDFRKALRGYRNNIRKVVAEARAKVKQQGQNLQDVLAKFEKDADASVARVTRLHQLILGMILATMTTILVHYIAAIYSGFRTANKGFCGLYMASWMLSSAMVIFQLLFPVTLCVSTLSLAVGTVFDRFLCFPAQHPGSPASLVIIDFLLTKTMEQARAVGRRHITENASVLLMVPALVQTGSELQPMRSRWEQNVSVVKCWDSTDEERNKKMAPESQAKQPMAKRRLQPDVTMLMPHYDGERWRLYQEIGRRNRTGAHAGLNFQTGNLAAVTGGQLDHSVVTASELMRPGEHGTNLTMLPKGSTKFAPEMLLRIGKRFAMCSGNHLSFMNLLGDDLTLRMARRILRTRRNKLLRLIESDRPLPTLDELQQLSGRGRLQQLDTALLNVLSISQDLINSLKKLANSGGITPAIFKQLAEEVKRTITDFGEIDSIRRKLRDTEKNVSNGTLRDMITVATDELDKITSDEKTAFKEEMDLILNASMELSAACRVDGKDLSAYMSEKLDKWDSMTVNTEKFAASLVTRLQNIKTGFSKDVQKYFSHAKAQIRNHFGDCHSLYVMYMTTVDIACNGGVRLFAGFWFSVWLYLVLGIPAWMVALATTTLYTKISAAMDSDVC